MKYLKAIPFLVLPVGFFIWSYILTDRSLIYSQFGPFLAFQNFMWRFADDHLLITRAYLLLVIGMYALYFISLRFINSGNRLNLKFWAPVLVFALLVFALSNNALSYDIYNYIFDAKLVVKYHLDPRSTSAMDFIATDDWVRFMRNIVFPTTYGYGWTAISLVPYLVGAGKFFAVYLAFKGYAILALGLLFLVQRQILKALGVVGKAAYVCLALFFLLPLTFVEALSSAHNDIWMMLLAFLSLLLLISIKKGSRSSRVFGTFILKISLSFALLYLSSQVKRATIALLPIWGLFVFDAVSKNFELPKLFRKIHDFFMSMWGDLAAALMFLPLLTPLSRRFHPWYLLWPLSFLPFVKNKLVRTMLMVFSFTSMLRYTPVLYTGMYSESIEAMQRVITWSAIPIGLLIVLTTWLWERRRLK